MTSEKSLPIVTRSASLISRFASDPAPPATVIVLASSSPTIVTVVVPDDPVDNSDVPKVMSSADKNTFPPLASRSRPLKVILSASAPGLFATKITSPVASIFPPLRSRSLPNTVKAPIAVVTPTVEPKVTSASPASMYNAVSPAESSSMVPREIDASLPETLVDIVMVDESDDPPEESTMLPPTPSSAMAPALLELSPIEISPARVRSPTRFTSNPSEPLPAPSPTLVSPKVAMFAVRSKWSKFDSTALVRTAFADPALIVTPSSQGVELERDPLESVAMVIIPSVVDASESNVTEPVPVALKLISSA